MSLVVGIFWFAIIIVVFETVVKKARRKQCPHCLASNPRNSTVCQKCSRETVYRRPL